MVRTQIQLTEIQSEKIKAMAKERKVSMATIIRESLDATLAGEITISTREKRERAKKIAGAFRSGMPDVGKEHDKYLNKAFE
ncbi:MAG: CopG family transcriptional regulator [Actinomycetota bacterium]